MASSDSPCARHAPVWSELTDRADIPDSLQRRTRVVGKVRLPLAPMANHWWPVLTTSWMHTAGRGLEMEFDLVHHGLELPTTGGRIGHVRVEPRSVARRDGATIEALAEVDRPVEIEVCRCGCWPGGRDEGSFDPDAYPEPDGVADWPIEPAADSDDRDLGEFNLPCRAERRADHCHPRLACAPSSDEATTDLARGDRTAHATAA